jgi:hypothetical protein
MSETNRPRHIGRSIGAVVAGFVAVVILSLGTDVVLHATGVFPPLGQPVSDALLLLATVYRTAFAIAGCYLTARLAPDRPMRHAMVGGVIGLVLSTVGAVVTWNKGPAFGPHWYPLALIATALPCAWAGGKIREMQLRARPAL